MIVLLGASGYVGQGIVAELSRRELDYLPLSRRNVDYYNVDQLADALTETRTQFLINAAGFTGRPNVDACEIHKAECLRANAVLPGKIRQACERLEIPWGHVSSGCIFTGSRPDGTGFSETDPPNFCFRTNNCSFYSGSKAFGEEMLADAEQCYIWRMRMPFNEVDCCRNYLSKLLRYERLLEARNSLSHLGDFAAACVESWTSRVPFGTYNLTNPGSITTYQVCERLRSVLIPNKRFRFFVDEAEFMQLAANAPRSNCVLDCSKALAAGLHLPPLEEAIERSLRHWRSASASGLDGPDEHAIYGPQPPRRHVVQGVDCRKL